jgi:uncharacterized protein
MLWKKGIILFFLAFNFPLISQPKDYPIKPVPFTSVKVTDEFWATRLKVNKEITIPIAFQKAEETGRIDNFKIAGNLMKGKFKTEYPFDDSDIYKNIEAASYSLQIQPDPKLEAYVDTLITYIAAAQEPDGYLYTCRTIDPLHPHEWSGTKRWELEDVLSHELYNAGHMFESAVAYFLATGKRTYLDIALRNADLVEKEFGWDKIEKAPGHQVIEMGLVKLYRVTGDERYLNLAKFFIDIRGQRQELGDYAQNHKRFVKQDSAVGHAVRAEYMYSGAADVAAMTGQTEYVQALDKIWEDVVYRKMYITGGTGASGGNEGFGLPYELPNGSAYCETCASIADVYWNYRMFLLHGEAKYFDVLERVLYNALLSGVSLSGDHFFYPNPLASTGQHTRSEWFGCACCPCNVTRLLPSVLGYVYAVRQRNVYVNLFMQSKSEIVVDGNKVNLKQNTKYPWNGAIEIEVNPSGKQKFQLMVRIPGWVTDQPLPGDLYAFIDNQINPVTLRVNGKDSKLVMNNGYTCIEREWKQGDKVQIDLPMQIRRIVANKKVAADRNKIALQRGPIVFCAEGIDHPSGIALNLIVDNDAMLTSEFAPGLLNGVQVIKGEAKGTYRTKDGTIEVHKQPFTAIPYYAWANRGSSEMTVWFGTTNDATIPVPQPTLASTSTISALHPRKSLSSVNSLYEPANSNDREIGNFNWWPRRDTVEWIQYDLQNEQSISQSSVYWFDDGPDGDCRIPASWRILYRNGDAWLPVKNLSPYEIEKNRYCKVTFEKISVKALRLEITLPKDHSSGIYKWEIE